MTSLPAADCSRSLLLQSGTRGRRWFDGVSVVQPVPMSMMTVGVVDLEVQQLAADRWTQVSISNGFRDILPQTSCADRHNTESSLRMRDNT